MGMRTVHMSLNVRANLRKSDGELKRMASAFIVDDVPLRTAFQVRELLMDELSKGHELIPMADCDNFDFKHGCLGHESKEA
jgi:hypothetical protein